MPVAAAVHVGPMRPPAMQLQVMLLRAQALGADGRVHDAADAARALIAQAIADDEPELLGLGEFFLGQGLTMLDDPSGATIAFATKDAIWIRVTVSLGQ